MRLQSGAAAVRRARRVALAAAMALAVWATDGYAASLDRAPARPLAACPAGDFALAAVTQRTASGMVALAWLTLRGPYPCRLHARLRLALQPAADAFLDPATVLGGVGGNPARVTLDDPLRPGVVVLRGWQWSNWCGAGGRFAILAQLQGSPSVAWSAPLAPPPCRWPGEPAQLTPVAPRLPACGPAGFRLATVAGQGYRERIVGELRLSRRGASPCRLRARVSLALQERSPAGWSNAGQIAGNPAAVTVGAVLAPGSPTELFWAWSNWCGSRSRFRWRAVEGARVTVAPVQELPVCGSPAAVSALKPFFDEPYPVAPRV